MNSAHPGVFRQQINQFLKDDIESCFLIRKAMNEGGSHYPGGLNFPAALILLCVIEMMAGYYKGTLDPKVDDVAKFLAKYFGRHEPLFSDENFCKRFYKVFRHGLAHQFSPMASAVAMDLDDSRILKLHHANGEDIMCLNVPGLYKITMRAFGDYKSDLDRGKHQVEFNKRYKKVLSRDYKEMRKLKEMYLSMTTT